jgi:hypothetical protein
MRPAGKQSAGRLEPDRSIRLLRCYTPVRIHPNRVSLRPALISSSHCFQFNAQGNFAGLVTSMGNNLCDGGECPWFQDESTRLRHARSAC